MTVLSRASADTSNQVRALVYCPGGFPCDRLVGHGTGEASSAFDNVYRIATAERRPPCNIGPCLAELYQNGIMAPSILHVRLS